MENAEFIQKVLLSVVVGCLCLAVPVGLIALRVSPWWRRRTKRKKHSTTKYPTALEDTKKASDKIRPTDTVEVPKQPRPGTLSGPAHRPGIGHYSHEDEVFPNGCTRAQYHGAGINDSTIEYLGLDLDPGAPSPQDAGMAIAEAIGGGYYPPPQPPLEDWMHPLRPDYEAEHLRQELDNLEDRAICLGVEYEVGRLREQLDGMRTLGLDQEIDHLRRQLDDLEGAIAEEALSDDW